MFEGKLDFMVFVAVFFIAAAVSLSNPLTGAAVLLVLITIWESLPRIPVLKKFARKN
jgi:hypothetical protein